MAFPGYRRKKHLSRSSRAQKPPRLPTPRFDEAEREDADESGRYEFADVPAGRYLVAVNPEGFEPEDEPYPATFYPAATDPAGATVVVVARWPGGAPAAGVQVRLGNADPSGPWDPTESDAEGRFEFTGYEGIDYRVWAEARTTSGLFHSAERPIAALGPAEGIELVLDREGEARPLWKR